jgi:hypothetical protein
VGKIKMWHINNNMHKWTPLYFQTWYLTHFLIWFECSCRLECAQHRCTICFSILETTKQCPKIYNSLVHTKCLIIGIVKFGKK